MEIKMKYTKNKCCKCKKADCELIISDGRFDFNKGKLYCQDCYYNKARKKELKQSSTLSIDVMELLRKANKEG